MDEKPVGPRKMLDGDTVYQSLVTYVQVICSRLGTASLGEYENLAHQLTGKTAEQRAKERAPNH
jgi:hypothetical protein